MGVERASPERRQCDLQRPTIVRIRKDLDLARTLDSQDDLAYRLPPQALRLILAGLLAASGLRMIIA